MWWTLPPGEGLGSGGADADRTLRPADRPERQGAAPLRRARASPPPEIHRALWNAIEDQGISPAGEPREIYLGDPAEAVGTSDALTEVAWPVDLSPDWRPDDRRFTKQLSTER
jgi:hypothetical protein